MKNRIHPDVEKILLTQEEISNTIKNLADRINKDYRDEELTVIVILKGSVIFASDLIRELTLPLSVEFMQVSSYGSQSVSSGKINIKLDLNVDISGKNVLIIEDIVDSGNTLSYLKKELISRNPKTCHICTLLDKPERRQTDVEIEYVGTKIPDEFVIGYGLDYDNKYRNLPYIGILKREVYM